MWHVYPRFIKYYAHIAKPLTELISKKIPHVLPPLDTSPLAAFEYLKELLTSTQILALPRSEGRFILYIPTPGPSKSAVHSGHNNRTRASSLSATTAGASSQTSRTSPQSI